MRPINKCYLRKFLYYEQCNQFHVFPEIYNSSFIHVRNSIHLFTFIYSHFVYHAHFMFMLGFFFVVPDSTDSLCNYPFHSIVG